jgi:hypothetical protein
MIYVGAYDHGETLLEAMAGILDVEKWDIVEAVTAQEALILYDDAPTANPSGPFIDWDVDFSDGHEGYMAVSERLIGCLNEDKLQRGKLFDGD